MRAATLLAVMILGCGPGGGRASDGGGDDDDAPPATDGGGIDAFAGPWSDFPAAPIVEGGAPAGAPGLFGDPASGAATGGPCLVEPEVGTLYPNNWLRPRFSWSPGAGENLYELRLTTANQVNPLVVYTSATQWTMPAAMWAGLTAHAIDQPITVTVRGATFSGGVLTAGPARGTSGDIAIAPVDAPGAIVYWTTTGGSALRGFHIGDETVRDIVRPTTAGAGVRCIGCHGSTPDGEFVGFAASPVPDNGDPTTLGLRSSDGMGTEPAFLTAAARALMARQGQEQPAFTDAHWQPGDRVAITMFPIGGRFEIMWTDLEATSQAQGQGWGVVARTGDANPAGYASFFHTTDDLLYVSAPNIASGMTTTSGDLARVPYAARQGGAAATIPGANSPSLNEYYPTASPDDRYVAFNRVPVGQSSYDNAQAEVFVIPSAGGQPVRLAANTPPTCSGRTSPGVTNSWPKWAPATADVGARRFYWLTFSSRRGASNLPQLYVTPVVDDGGTLRTYPALYLWNQPAGESNHTPAWDDFDIVIGKRR